MLFIIGTTVKQKEITDYDFAVSHCPNCGQELKIIEASRWFSLFFIAVFKIETLGHYYYCSECQSEYSYNDFKNKTKTLTHELI